MKALGIDLDAVLGNTRPLWEAWVGDLRRRARVEVELPEDRVAAAAVLDGVVANWRALLERFAEEHAPVYLRPDAAVNEALRRIAASGARLGAFTDAPEPLARVAAADALTALRMCRLGPGDEALLAELDRDDAVFDVPGRRGARGALSADAAAAYVSDPAILHWVAEEDGALIGHLLCYVERRRRG